MSNNKRELGRNIKKLFFISPSKDGIKRGGPLLEDLLKSLPELGGISLLEVMNKDF
jgi:hypothetical protein